MTLQQAKQACESVGCSLVKVNGEYQVQCHGLVNNPGNSGVYFTDDIEDAVDTAHAMSMELSKRFFQVL